MFSIESLDLNKNYILSKVSEFQIFSYYCKNFKQLNKGFCSELRLDKKPSCSIRVYSSGLYYKDYSTGDYFDCFSYIQAKFKSLYNIDLSYFEVLKVIANDFKIIKGITDLKIEKSLNYIGLADKNNKQSRIIRIKKRNWYKSDTYWEDYNYNLNLLKFYNVIPVDNYWLNNSQGFLDLLYSYTDNVFDPCYSYEEGDGLRKLLRPYNDKFKWLSNLPRNIYSGYKQLDNNADTLIITSSLKDVIGWRLFSYNAIATQSESMFISDNALELLKYRFKKIIINYDNDKAGLSKMEDVAIKYPYIKRFITEKKDISDNIYFKGIDSTKKLINNINKNLF
jgi:hypothetical protein